MAGDIELYSEPGSGSVFSFTLELDKAALPLAEPLPLAELTGKTVLYQEEDGFSRRATSALLREWGMQVLYEPSAEQPVDMALLGFGPHALPSQIEQELRRQLAFDNKTVILLSSTDPTLSDSLLAAGAAHCLSKPAHYHKLAQALTEQRRPADEPVTPIALPPPASRLPLRVLAVDDNPANLKLISAMLGELVSQVDTGRNGQEALNLATVNQYDIIFMDIQMPVLDGIQATREIRGQGGPNATTPIVAVTAHAIAGERDRLLDQGMDDYLAKPIDETILTRIISHFAHKPETRGQIDWSLALQRAGGKETLAREMLSLLLQSFDEFTPRLSAALAGELGENALYGPLHKLHGGAVYCGVPQLQSLLAGLEQALLDKQPIDDLEPELLELEERIEQIREEARAYL